MPARRVFQTGTFDVQNYGDLLFPLLADFHLKPWDVDILPISPTGFDTGWRDTMNARAFAAMLRDPGKIDAVLIGGGNIVHAEPALLRDYEAASVSDRAYAELWLGATLVAAVRNIPALWNAPGVPIALTEELEAAGATIALRAADYLSVRDAASAKNLGPNPPECRVVPDTAADLARMWPRPVLALPFKTLIERKAAPPDAKFLAIHVKQRSLDSDHAAIAAQIEQFAKSHELTPILVAIGLCHDDHVTARRIARHLRIAHVLLDDPIGLTEIAAAIAHATLYLGASLHGYITSAAYDVPGVVVAQPPLVKFAGFLAHIDRPEDLAEDWRAAFAIGASRLAEPPLRRIPDAVFQALDAHWERVASALVAPAPKMVERTRFLRHYVKHGVGTRGDPWLFEPLLAPPSRRTSHKPAKADAAD